MRLANRRFQSFSEAADSVLGALEETIPGTLMLGQLDPDKELCRVIDVRGDGIDLQREMTLPLAVAPAYGDAGSAAGRAHDVPIEAELDQGFLRSLSAEAWLTVPLEMGDGSIVGTLCALDTRTDAYRSDHVVLLGVAARVLSYDWESVRSRAELRRLRDRLRDDQSTDADTGLPNRASFLDLLEREWLLVERGSVQSVLVGFQIEVEAAGNGHGEAMANVALKDAAEVLNATVRSTDHVGRTGANGLAAILVGCHGVEGAQSFVQRFRAAVERVTHGRSTPISVSCSLQPLTGFASPAEALEHAERGASAREAKQRSHAGQGA